MIIGDIRLTADNHVELVDVDNSVQCRLTIGDVLDFYGWCLKKRDVLLERYRQENAKYAPKPEQEKSE